nr:hypothetical protein [uncultured Celeribacter sp.]
MTEFRAAPLTGADEASWRGTCPGGSPIPNHTAGAFATYQARIYETPQERERAELREILKCAVAAALISAAILGATHLLWTGPVQDHIAARICASAEGTQ